MGSDREPPKPSFETTKPKRRQGRNEPRQVAPTPPPAPAAPPPPDIAGGQGDDLQGGRDRPGTRRRAGSGGATRLLETVAEAEARKRRAGGPLGLTATPPPPTPVPREEKVSDDFARPPGYRPDMASEGPRSARRQTAKSPGATADRHSQDRRSASRGRFAAPQPQKAPKPLSGREFNDGLKRGGVDPDRPVTPDTLRQAVGERDYQRRRDPGLFAGVAAGFRSLFPGEVARDATGRMKPSQPRGGVTFRSVLDELGIGSLDAAQRAGRRKATAKAAGTIAGGNGDDTLGGAQGDDVAFDATGPLSWLRDAVPKHKPLSPDGPGGTFREAIHVEESNVNDYRAFNSATNAAGRYQLTPNALIDAGFMNRDGRWTGAGGVNSLEDFLGNPQAQEEAFTNFTRAQHSQLDNNGSLDNRGDRIIGRRAAITVTVSGLIAAAHRRGARTVARYLDHVARNGGASNLDDIADPELQDAFAEVETRLRKFEDVPLTD